MTNLDGKTFVCGVGVQKAGTTWLNSYLRSREDFYLPRVKELHYFDHAYRSKADGELPERAERQLLQLVQSDYDNASPHKRERLIDLIDRIKMHIDEKYYKRFFEDRVPEQATHFADITPSYSTLPEEGFRRIKEIFPSAKFILLLRDPIERYYSALRMRQGKHEGFSARENVVRYLRKSGFVARTRYDQALTNLYNGVGRDCVYVGFYETFFTEPEVRRLCGFLEVPYVEPAFDRVVNKSPDKEALSEEDVKLVREAFDEVYSFCAREFAGSLPAKWKL